MVQPFWIKKNEEGKYGIVRGKEAVKESSKAADWAIDKTSKALNTGSAFVGGGPKGVKELWKTGDTSSTVGEALPRKLGIKNPLGAFAVGMAGEVLTPEPTDIMGGDFKDVPRVWRAANKSEDVTSSYLKKLDADVFNPSKLGNDYELLKEAIPKAVNDNKLIKKLNSLLNDINSKPNLTAPTRRKLDKFMNDVNRLDVGK